MKPEEQEEFKKVWTKETVKQILSECYRSGDECYTCSMSVTFEEIWSTHAERIRLLGNAFCPECATHVYDDILFNTTDYRATFKGFSRRALVIEFLKSELKRLSN